MTVGFKSNLPAVTAAVEAAGKACMIAGLAKAHELTVKNLKHVGHGRTYRLPGQHGTWVASAEGEFPAVRLAQLSGPGGVETESVSESNEFVATIGSRLKHGLFLEKRPESKGGRPWLKRTIDENRDTIVKAFVDQFNKSMHLGV
jgi:hypothetical protein